MNVKSMNDTAAFTLDPSEAYSLAKVSGDNDNNNQSKTDCSGNYQGVELTVNAAGPVHEIAVTIMTIIIMFMFAGEFHARSLFYPIYYNIERAKFEIIIKRKKKAYIVILIYYMVSEQTFK